MRIVLDGRTIQDHFPGIARYTYSLAVALARAEPADELIVLCDPAARNTRHDMAMLSAMSNIRIVPAAAPVFSIREQWQIPRQIARLKPDVIHAPYYIRPYRMPAPAVFTAHDLIPLKNPEYFGPGKRLIFYLATLLSLRTASATIAVSRSTARDLSALYAPAERLFVVPEAAGPAFALQSEDAVRAIRNKYGLPGGLLLYLGSNKPHKNLARLVEATAKAVLRQPSSNLALVIAGHWDPRYAEARARAEACGIENRVIFLGPVDDADLPTLYGAAEVFIFPSLYEGFGLPVLEAMACGAPVICSNTSSLPEVAGEAAMLVNPLDVQELAAAINLVSGEPHLRQDMKEKGLAQAARFTWERTAKETRAVYGRVAAGG